MSRWHHDGGRAPTDATTLPASPTLPTMSRIVVRDLTKSFGELPVIAPFDLDVEVGEFVSIIGPSGCGKKIGRAHV